MSNTLYEKRLRKLQQKAQKGAWDLRCAVNDLTQGNRGEDARIVYPDCRVSLEWIDAERPFNVDLDRDEVVFLVTTTASGEPFVMGIVAAHNQDLHDYVFDQLIDVSGYCDDMGFEWKNHDQDPGVKLVHTRMDVDVDIGPDGEQRGESSFAVLRTKHLNFDLTTKLGELRHALS